jgi:RHS repeat-associated protein
LLAGLSAAPTHAEKFAFYHLDALGSPVAAADEAGNLLWREDYTPYGDRLINDPATANETRWYTGHVHDQDTGLTYMGARYYDPTLGRFMGVDPAEFQESAIHSFNRYAYANHNPYRYIDPDGNFPIDYITDIPFVVYDAGRVLGAGLAYAHGVLTGNEALQSAGLGGLQETSIELGGSVAGWAIPYAPAAITRGVAKGAGEVANRAARNPNAYEVIFEAPISGASRSAHRASANQSLANQLRVDGDFAGMMNRGLSTDVLGHMQSGRGLLNPPGSVWHHPVDNPSVMQLLRRSEHTSPSLQHLLHPNGIGGYGTFYGP